VLNDVALSLKNEKVISEKIVEKIIEKIPCFQKFAKNRPIDLGLKYLAHTPSGVFCVTYPKRSKIEFVGSEISCTPVGYPQIFLNFEKNLPKIQF
jgi:hypothetical protein